jgi:hypothetical protein
VEGSFPAKLKPDAESILGSAPTPTQARRTAQPHAS